MLFDITTYVKPFENFGNNLADRWDPVLFVFIFMLSTKTTKIFLIFIDIQNIPIITIINKAHFKSVNRLHCASRQTKTNGNNGAVVLCWKLPDRA